jgi:hypothetical protein
LEAEVSRTLAVLAAEAVLPHTDQALEAWARHEYPDVMWLYDLLGKQFGYAGSWRDLLRESGTLLRFDWPAAKGEPNCRPSLAAVRVAASVAGYEVTLADGGPISLPQLAWADVEGGGRVRVSRLPERPATVAMPSHPPQPEGYAGVLAADPGLAERVLAYLAVSSALVGSPEFVRLSAECKALLGEGRMLAAQGRSRCAATCRVVERFQDILKTRAQLLEAKRDVRRGSTTMFRLCAVVAFVAMVCPVAVAGGSWADYQAAKQKALAPLQAEFERIVAAHKEDPAVRKYRERLGLVDEVAARVLRALDAINVASAAGIAGSALGDQGGTEPPSADAGGLPVPDALRLLAEYGSAFEEELLVPDLPQEEQAALWTYVDVGMSETVAQMAERAQVVHAGAPAEELAHQALCLAVSLPLLNTRDGEWSTRETEALPEWMRTPQNCQALEAFSLRARRPLAAWQFALRAPAQPATTGDRAEYLLACVARGVEMRDYGAAAACCNAGIAFAKAGADDDGAAEFSVALAEVCGAGGNPSQAAEQLAEALRSYPNAGLWGDAATLRLRCLYEGGRFDEVLVEVSSRTSDRAVPSRPPSWRSHLPVSVSARAGYSPLGSRGYQHGVVREAGDVGEDLTPACHRVASLLKRWLLGTHQGAVSHRHLAYYLDEFTFRFIPFARQTLLPTGTTGGTGRQRFHTPDWWPPHG